MMGVLKCFESRFENIELLKKKKKKLNQPLAKTNAKRKHFQESLGTGWTTVENVQIGRNLKMLPFEANVTELFVRPKKVEKQTEKRKKKCEIKNTGVVMPGVAGHKRAL